MSFASIIAAFQEVEVLLKNYGPLSLAALAALKAGGWQALLAFLENLLKNPQPAGPPVADVQRAIASLRAAHA